MELTGFASNKNINFYAQFLRHRAPSNIVLTEVLLWLPEVLDTSTSNLLTITSIPAALRQSVDQRIPLCIADAGVAIVGQIVLTASGDWSLLRFDNTGLAATGTKGIAAQLIRYRLSIA